MSAGEVSRQGDGAEAVVCTAEPVEVVGRIVAPPQVYVSPLAGGGHCLTGGVVADPWEFACIRAQAEFYARPLWRRVGRRPSEPARPGVLPIAPYKIVMPSPREVEQ